MKASNIIIVIFFFIQTGCSSLNFYGPVKFTNPTSGKTIQCIPPKNNSIVNQVKSSAAAAFDKKTEKVTQTSISADFSFEEKLDIIRDVIKDFQTFEEVDFRMCAAHAQGQIPDKSYEIWMQDFSEKIREIIKSSPGNQTNLSGVLQPANDPAPASPCQTPSNAYTVYLGSSAAYTRQFPHTVLRVGSEDLIALDKNTDGIYLDAKIFSADQRIVAEIRKNKFDVNPNNYFRIERPDGHTLIVYDQQAKQVLNIRYLNASSIKLLGIFNFPNYKPIIIQEDKLMINSNSLIKMCFGDSRVDIAIE